VSRNSGPGESVSTDEVEVGAVVDHRHRVEEETDAEEEETRRDVSCSSAM
jgi:inorganic pyrophosphatase/exopolyphosphatase